MVRIIGNGRIFTMPNFRSDGLFMIFILPLLSNLPDTEKEANYKELMEKHKQNLKTEYENIIKTFSISWRFLL